MPVCEFLGKEETWNFEHFKMGWLTLFGKLKMVSEKFRNQHICENQGCLILTFSCIFILSLPACSSFSCAFFFYFLRLFCKTKFFIRNLITIFSRKETLLNH